MFSKFWIWKSADDYSARIDKLAAALVFADAVVVGAGLSTAAGFEYSGKRFETYFADFEKRYGFHDMYSGGFYPFETPEERWAYWSRFVYVNRYQDPPKPLYSELLRLVEKKDYFVVTTNVDHCFQKAGFDKERLFYTQGDYGLWQCSAPCHKKTYDNEEAIKEMLDRQRDGRIPSELVPRCPVCGRPMTMNLRSDSTFVEDDGWRAAEDRYSAFLKKARGAKTLFLELGVGFNTPVIIKYSFRIMTRKRRKSLYASVNADPAQAAPPPEIAKRSIALGEDVAKVVADLRERLSAAEGDAARFDSPFPL